jgi:hypothetical protein
MQKIIDYKVVWQQLQATSVLNELCMISIYLIFGCMIFRFVADIYIKKQPIDLRSILAHVMSAGVLAVLIGNVAVYKHVSDLIVLLYSSVDSMTLDFVDKARDQIKYLIMVLVQHESDPVSFFNPVGILTNPLVFFFSGLLNISIIAIVIALVIPTVYLFFIILAAPIMLPFSMVFGGKIFAMWAKLILACVLCQASIGIAFLIIGDLNIFTLIGDYCGSGSIHLALVFILLSIVICVFIPLFHGYIFDAKIFYVFPLLFGIVTFVFGGFVVLIKTLAVLRSLKVSKK